MILRSPESLVAGNDHGPDTNNTEGLRSALARLRNRTGPSVPPSTVNIPTSNGQSHSNEHFVPRSPIFHKERKTPPLTPAPPSTPRNRTKEGVQPSAMTVSVTHATQGVEIITTKATMGRPNSPSNNGVTATTKPTTTTTAKPLSTMNGTDSVIGSNSSGSDTDGFANSATALRRLYFKSGRSVKTKLSSVCGGVTSATTNKANSGSNVAMNYLPIEKGSNALSSTSVTTTSTGVPKVVIMGSSSASVTDANINTSTDSASTLITSVAATDTSETYDSLDMGDTSGQSEPLFSSLEEPLLTAIQIDSEHDGGTEMELTSCTLRRRPEMNFQDSTESQESSLSIIIEPSSTTPLLASHNSSHHHIRQKQKECSSQPRTAPSSTAEIKHFTFDQPLSPMSASPSYTGKDITKFTFKDGSDEDERNYKHARRSGKSHHNYDDRGTHTTNFIENGKNGSNARRQRELSPGKNKYKGSDAIFVNGGRVSYFTGKDTNAGDVRMDESVAIACSGKNHRIRESKYRGGRTNERSRYPSSGCGTSKTSPKAEFRRSSSISNAKESSLFLAKQQQQQQRKQLSPSSQHGQRKYSSSSSSGGSERVRDGILFPFDREAIDYDRIQRECFAVDENGDNNSSTTTTSSSDSDDPEPCSVYERKQQLQQPPGNVSPKTTEIFYQYAMLSQMKHQTTGNDEMSRKNSKRNRPDPQSTVRNFIPKTDAFFPQASQQHAQPSDQHAQSISPADLNKFEDIVSKFDQIPPKPQHGSNANLSINQQQHHEQMPSSVVNYNNNNNNNSCIQTNSNNNGQNSLYGSSGTRATTPTGSLRGGTPPPLPNLRVDFFAESKMHHHHHQNHHQQQQQQHNKSNLSKKSKLPHDNLDECQRLSQNITSTAGSSGSASPGAINVTSNPMEAAVCTQPRATIVVQQPSLSLDSTVETLLIKNEGDFVSLEQGKESRNRNGQHPQQHGGQYHNHQQQQQKRDENMRQLLDVTNTLTFEELRDFEMRYGSPHHSRSQSVKTPGSRASGRPNQLCLPQQRSRVASMPNTGVEEEYYRLRHFSITGKGVINRGDSLKSRRSRSNNSVASSNSSTEHLTATQIPAPNSARTSATCSLASSRESSTSNPGSGPYRVLMLGGPAVGKSSLVSQFMTSEYLHAYDTSIDDDSGEKSVSVLLSGEESELIFIDHTYTDMTPADCLSSYNPHGYCVIYSSADRSSFNVAESILQVLWTNENIAQKAVILVGNKADLARSRLVTSEEGKAMATAYDCKFIETSVGINHNVDELLVGLLSQIRLKLENPEKSRDLFRKRSTRKSKRRACSPLGGACLAGNSGTNPNTPLGPVHNVISDAKTPPGSAHSSPRKYRGSRTSASLKVKGLLGRVWARDSKSKSCENLHVL